MLGKTLTSMLAIAWTGAACAQTASPNAQSTDQAPSALEQQPQPGSAAKTAQGQPTELSAQNGDIVVTAQRRSERLVDVPVSISTASASDLARVGPESLENLTKAVPGVYLQRNVYGLSPTIRGIGSTLGSEGGEENVATYIDGVYQPTASGNIFDLASVSDVEILKGPQGTLFGRNATGGALLIKTLDPDFTRSGRFNVSYERFNEVRVGGYLNLPLTDTLAVNGAISYLHTPGYIHDERTGALVNEARNFTARGKLLYQPAHNFSILLTAAHNYFNDPSGSDYQSIVRAPALLLPGENAGPIATDRYHLSHNTQDVVRTTAEEYSAHIKLDLGVGTLTSITAYQRNTIFSVNDIDSTYATTPAPITLPPPFPPIVVGFIPTMVALASEVNTKTFSQEVNLTSKSNQPFTYVAGLYYFHNRGSAPFLLVNGVEPISHSLGINDAYAAYVDGTYKFDRLSVIAGVRYSHENRRVDFGPGASDPTPFTTFLSATDNKFTPRAGLRYSLSSRSNVYATYSKGFKSGVFDPTTGNSIKPETVDAFEVGFKTASRPFSLNAAGFYYNYKNTQVNSVVSGPNGAIFAQLRNVPKSEIYGADIDATVQLNDAFDVHAAFAYTHARYKNFPNAPGYTLDPTNPNTAFGLIFANISVDASGRHMVRAPDYTASGTISYHTQLTERDRLDVTVTPYYSSRVYFDFVNSLSQAPYATVDAAATLTLAGNTTISVFGRNLTDNAYYLNQGQNTYGKQGTFAKPRTYGVSLGLSF